MNSTKKDSKWNELSEERKSDLLDFYNVAPVCVDDDDLELLAEHEHKITSFMCEECGEHLCHVPTGDLPWEHFQGVNVLDFASYPGNTEKYTSKYLGSCCDTCRCYVLI